MDISIIVATAINGGIGKNNQLLWHLPADLKFFKETTTGHPVIMGRKTFESVGRPLPNRTNIVITRNVDWHHEGVKVAKSLKEALSFCPEHSSPKIIGGGEIYREALPMANRIYLTLVATSPDADTYFPPIHPGEWKEVECTKKLKDDKNEFDMEFKIFERIV